MQNTNHIIPTLLFIIAMCVSCGNDDVPVSEPDMTIEEPEDPNTLGNFEGTVTFVNSYGGSQEDTFQSIIVTQDGGYLALGHSQSIDGDITDNTTQQNMFWLLKTDTDGAVQWSKTYGGSDDDRGQKVIQTDDGGYALVGYSRSSDGDTSGNNGFYDQWIVKLDASGAVMWEKNFGFSGSDQAFSIIQTADGGYFTAGFLDVTASEGEGNDGRSSNNNRHGVGEFWGHKLDAQGNLLWRRYFGGTNNDRAYDVVEAQDGGILMVGASESTDFDVTASQGSYDFWVVRLDQNGNKLWEKSYGGTEIDIAYAVTKTSDGNYVLAGDTRSADGNISSLKGGADVWLVKINDQGTILWEKTLGGTGFDTARAITTLGSKLVVSGASRSVDGDVETNAGQSDLWIAVTEADGSISYQKAIGGSALDFGYGITTTTTGAIIVAGDSQSNDGAISNNKGSVDGVIIKIE